MADVLERGRVAAAEMARLATAILDRVPEEHRPLLLAMLERGAGARYRRWAEEGADGAEHDGLVACAGREEAIADTVEAMVSNAADILASFEPHLPALREAYAQVYGGKTRHEKFAIQAAGERVGAEIWRGFAAAAPDRETAAALLRCAALEEASASFLEDLLATSISSTQRAREKQGSPRA